jgi:LmbE family N-acetylglucosaminyl deacetylase
MTRKSAIAIGAHPDDIEFYMAGTLLLLKGAGFEIHYLTVASGNCGTVKYDSATTRKIRAAESRAGARRLGATWHPSITDDLEIVYGVELLRPLTAVIREVRPSILLTHSPQDYMEDHTNTCRLAVTAAFARGAPNFKSKPARAASDFDVTVYHAMPHGLRDSLRARIIPGAFVNTTSVHSIKREALAAHRSQQDWLDTTQKMNSYLQTMEDFSREVGRMSRKFVLAEGWRRHLHLGFCHADSDPLRDALGKDCLVNKAYERSLQRGLPANALA